MSGSRGALYVVWEPAAPRADGFRIGPYLERAVASFKQFHPELPHHVVTLPKGSTLHDKAGMFDHKPFETTVFLDADTVVLGRLDHGFEMAERFGIAQAHCVNPWLRRYASVSDDAIEYNTGVMFFTDAARPIFDAWKQLSPQLDSSTHFVRGGQILRSPRDDQLSYSQAMRQAARPPFILPHNWNFTPPHHHTFFGPLKVWHNYADVPPIVREINRYYEQPEAVIQFHQLTTERPAWQAPG
jgi:hypothetical protein